MDTPILQQPSTQRNLAARRFGQAWLLLAIALALHVSDEALTDFLAVYNPTVLAIRERLPWLPLPVFSFSEWIAGLAVGIAVLFALTPAARRAGRWIVVAALPLSVLMVFNGLGHIGASLYTGRFMSGVYSSPVLIAAALFALISAWRMFRLGNEGA